MNANPHTTIKPDEAQTFYYTYPNTTDKGKTTIKAGCYKKIVYKELYPHIDVEYILPEKGGVKYSLILHPGADLSQVKMRYTNSKKIKTDEEGNIIIKSDFGDFVDHAPVSFYSSDKSPVPSSFIRNGNEIAFNAGDYNNSKELIIDPWTANPGFPVNKAYDVNYDQFGNVYICGSASTTQSYKLAKYNSAGTPLWVFTTDIGPTLGATSYGDFSVDEITGTSYVMGTWAALVKVNTLGFQTGSLSSAAFPGGFELWRCEYSRCLNKIIAGCGGISFSYQAAMIDTSLNAITPFNLVGATSALHDIALLTIDPNSSFAYMATAKSQGDPLNFDNIIMKMPIPSLLPLTWGPVADGHTFVEVSSVSYTPVPSVGGANGFNGMACGPRFLYTYDGSVLKKWNKNTGAFIAQIITGGTMFATGGLSADKCDNVYAGVGSVINEYNSSLVLIATYPVANTCYDVKLGPNNKLYACGNSFVAQIDVPALSPPTATATPASGCNACNGTATALPCGDPAGYDYLWNSGQTTQIATGLCPGTYTVSITYACSDVDVVTVSVPGGAGGITLSSTQSNVCANSGSVTLTPTGGVTPYTYSWSSGQTTAALTGLPAGNYTVTATDANGCSTFKVIKIINTINITSTSAYSSCSGGNTGSITLNVNGGSAAYTYNWNNGQTSATAINLSAGIYTVTVTDANGCAQTTVANLAAYAPITIQTDQTVACSTNAQATVITTNGGTPFYNYNWSNSQVGQTATNLAVGTYTVTATDANGCTGTKSVTITNGPNPANASFTQSPTGNICAGACVNFTNTGSTGNLVQYKWAIPGQGPVVSGSVTDFTSAMLDFTYCFSTPGTYTVNHTISYPSGGCTATQSTTVNVTTCNTPTVTTTATTICAGSCSTVTSNPTGGTPAYTYSWSTGETTQNINPCPGATTTYTVKITDSGGATATTTATVTVNPAVSVSATAILNCGTNNGSVTATVAGGSSNFTYSWSNGTSSATSSATSQISSLTSNTYSVTVTDAKGCTASSSAIIAPPFAAQYIKGTANCAGCGCKEWIMVTPSNGRAPYTYAWPSLGGYDKRYKNQICPGSYTIAVTDKNGCTSNVIVIAP
jgi:hypothetical protein